MAKPDKKYNYDEKLARSRDFEELLPYAIRMADKATNIHSESAGYEQRIKLCKPGEEIDYFDAMFDEAGILPEEAKERKHKDEEDEEEKEQKKKIEGFNPETPEYLAGVLNRFRVYFGRCVAWERMPMNLSEEELYGRDCISIAFMHPRQQSKPIAFTEVSEAMGDTIASSVSMNPSSDDEGLRKKHNGIFGAFRKPESVKSHYNSSKNRFLNKERVSQLIISPMNYLLDADEARMKAKFIELEELIFRTAVADYVNLGDNEKTRRLIKNTCKLLLAASCDYWKLTDFEFYREGVKKLGLSDESLLDLNAGIEKIYQEYQSQLLEFNKESKGKSDSIMRKVVQDQKEALACKDGSSLKECARKHITGIFFLTPEDMVKLVKSDEIIAKLLDRLYTKPQEEVLKERLLEKMIGSDSPIIFDLAGRFDVIQYVDNELERLLLLKKQTPFYKTFNPIVHAKDASGLQNYLDRVKNEEIESISDTVVFHTINPARQENKENEQKEYKEEEEGYRDVINFGSRVVSPQAQQLKTVTGRTISR